MPMCLMLNFPKKLPENRTANLQSLHKRPQHLLDLYKNLKILLNLQPRPDSSNHAPRNFIPQLLHLSDIPEPARDPAYFRFDDEES